MGSGLAEEADFTDSEEYMTLSGVIPRKWDSKGKQPSTSNRPTISRNGSRVEVVLVTGELNELPHPLHGSSQTSGSDPEERDLSHKCNPKYNITACPNHETIKKSLKTNRGSRTKFGSRSDLEILSRQGTPNEYLSFPPYKGKKGFRKSITDSFRSRLTAWGLRSRKTENPSTPTRDPFGPTVYPTSIPAIMADGRAIGRRRTISVGATGIVIAPRNCDVGLVTMEVTRRQKSVSASLGL